MHARMLRGGCQKNLLKWFDGKDTNVKEYICHMIQAEYQWTLWINETLT